MGVKQVSAITVSLGCLLAPLGFSQGAQVQRELSASRTQLLWLRYDGAQFQILQSEIRPDSFAMAMTNPLPAGSGLFRFTLESAKGEILYAGAFEDPRQIHADSVSEDGQVRGETLLLPETIFPLRVPYFEEALRLRISGEEGPTASLSLDPILSLEVTNGLPNYTTQTIWRTGPSSNRLDIVFLGDGYRATEMGKFDRDVRAFADYMLQTPPYAPYRQAINIHKVNVISRDSGIDRPSRGIFRDTALDMTFDFQGMPGAIYAPAESEYKIYRAAALVPEADLIVVLVNERDLGGSSGPLKNISVVTTHALGPDMLLHELGHSFAFLADESDGPAAPPLREPTKANVTGQRTREGLREVGKWDYWIEPGQPLPTPEGSPGVGLFEGALGASKGVYRPAQTCKMRALGQPFCPICLEQHVRRLYFYIRPIDAVSPQPADLASMSEAAGEPLTLRVVPLSLPLETVEIQWFVDGLPVGHHDTSLSISTTSLPPGPHTIAVIVTDRTPLVRWDPTGRLSSHVTWRITR